MSTDPEYGAYDKQLKAMKALTNPIRVYLHDFFKEPHTATEAAEKFRLKRTGLYYHIRILEEAGLVKKVNQKKSRNLTESCYQITGKPFFRREGMPGAEPTTDFFKTVQYAAASTWEDSIYSLQPGDGKKSYARRFFIRLKRDSFQRIHEGIVEMCQVLERRIRELEQEDGDLIYSLTIINFEMPDEEKLSGS